MFLKIIALSYTEKKNDNGKNWPQYLVTVSVALAIFTASLNMGWPTPSIPKLFDKEYPHDVSNDMASYITIISFVGFMSGGLGNMLLDRIGRKKTIQIIAIPQVLSFLCIAMSYEMLELIYVGRFLGGVGEGITVNVIILYIAEIADPKIRGRLGCILGIVTFVAVLFMNVIGSYLSIRPTAFILIIFPIIFTVAFWKCPESPYYLLIKHKEEEAEKALKFLRWKKNVSQEVASLKKDVERQMSETGTIKEIFTIDSNRKTFLVAIGGRFFQVCTGVQAFNLYLQVLLKEATGSLESHVGASAILSAQVVMNIILTFIVDKWDRKPLLLFSISGCFLTLVVQTVYFILREHTYVDVSAIEWFPLVIMILQIVSYSAGLGMVNSILISELYSASIKAKMAFLSMFSIHHVQWVL